MASADIVTKRIYEDAANRDGHRVLVDRIWPRGVSKDDAHLNDWCKELAPSDDLREWFDHDVDKLDELVDIAKDKRVTLLYGAKDDKHNQAVVLKEVLCERS